MASTYSNSLKIQLMGNGEDSGTWGTITNTNWNLIEQAVSGVQTITMANANYTLSNLNGVSDEARNMVLNVIGTNSGIYQVVAPLVTKFYIISNNTTGGYAITVGASTGSVITVPNGVTVQVYCDGSTGFFSAQTGSAGNFLVNGNLSVTGNEVEVGNMTVGGTFGATGASTFTGATALNGGGTSITPTTGDSSTKIATTAFVAANAVLTGSLLMWATNTAPSGYLLCQGAAVSRTTYAALFSVIGTTFGVGDGSTTFNLPNYADAMPIGKGSIATSIGAVGGSKDAIVVNHTHTATVTDPGHAHTTQAYFIPSSPNGFSGSGGAGQASSGTNSAVTNISVTNLSTGVSGTNANLPPYLGINFVIKI